MTASGLKLDAFYSKKKVFIALGSILAISIVPFTASRPIIVTLCTLSVRYAVAVVTFSPDMSISRSYGK